MKKFLSYKWQIKNHPCQERGPDRAFPSLSKQFKLKIPILKTEVKNYFLI